jgi:hypothetical protein
MYVKLLLLSIAEYVAENKEQMKEEVLYPLDFLKPYFEDLPEELKKSWYSNFARMKQALNSIKNFDRINSFLKYYQVEITVNQSDLFFRIKNKDVILNLRDIYLQNPSTSSTASTHLQASETQYNASLEGSKISSTSSTKQHLEDKSTDKEEDKQESEELSKKSKAKTTPSKSFVNAGIEPNRRVEEVEKVDKFYRTISQSEEPTEDKTQKDTSDTIESRIIKKLRELKKVRVYQIKDYFTEEEAKVMLKMLDEGALVLEEKQEGIFVALNEASQKPQDELVGKYSKLEKDIIDTIKNPPIGRQIYKFELVSFLEQRGYKPEDIEKALNKLIKEGIVILYPDEKLEINFSKLGGG